MDRTTRRKPADRTAVSRIDAGRHVSVWPFAALLAVAGLVHWCGAHIEPGAPVSSTGTAILPGTGSSAALPFGRAGSIGSVAGDGAAAASPPSSTAPDPDLPPAVAALGTEPAASALARLALRARAKDAVAAREAYAIADFCAVIERSRDSLLAQPAVAPDPGLDARRARFERGRRICDGVTPAQRSERLTHLRLAAEGANAGAAVEMLEIAQRLARDADAAADAAAEIRSPAWGERAVELARRDARDGDIDALTALTRLYQLGGVVEPDADQALAFALATEARMRQQPQVYSPGELAMAQLLVIEFESKLGADRSDAARRVAAEIAAR